MRRLTLIAALLIGAAGLSACDQFEALMDGTDDSEPWAPLAGSQAKKWVSDMGLTEDATGQYQLMEVAFECAKLAESSGDMLKDVTEKISDLYEVGFEAGRQAFRNISADSGGTGPPLPLNWGGRDIAAAFSGMALLDSSYRVEASLASMADDTRKIMASSSYHGHFCEMIRLTQRR